MTNFIQLIPATPAAQFYAAPIATPAASQPVPGSQSIPGSQQSLSASQPPLVSSQPLLAATQTVTATQLAAPPCQAPALDPKTLYFYRGSSTAYTALPTYQQAECLDAPIADDQLPERPTCPMPYHAVTAAIGEASKKLYLVCPGRIQGLYDDDKKADANVKKFRNGRGISHHRWTDAEAEWAMCCLRWHGQSCPNARPRVTLDTRVVLNPALLAPAVPIQWAVRGLEDFFPSRECAFAAANAKNLQEVHVLGSIDEAALQAWTGVPA
ncbi:hypothetical protein C8R47DRAFT_1067474 [Mycena vitilis]|nr:hypothetical protein C8R47DRAFT_1067474 [Mycena vitilis]